MTHEISTSDTIPEQGNNINKIIKGYYPGMLLAGFSLEASSDEFVLIGSETAVGVTNNSEVRHEFYKTALGSAVLRAEVGTTIQFKDPEYPLDEGNVHDEIPSFKIESIRPI